MTKGEGGLKSQKIDDVFYERPLTPIGNKFVTLLCRKSVPWHNYLSSIIRFSDYTVYAFVLLRFAYMSMGRGWILGS